MKEWIDYFASLGFEYTYLGQKGGAEATIDFQSLREEVADCKRCGLHATRTQTVFGTGDPSADLLFIGEAPGADEDRQGEPFVGRAGKLLTKMIGAMGLQREEVYICNILKCRPPGNRDPEPEEIRSCFEYLEKQIAHVDPRVVVTVGRIATQVLTGSTEPISRMRGHWYDFRGRPVMPIFHPSYLLRQPGKKREAWEDLQKVMERLGLPIPPR